MKRPVVVALVALSICLNIAFAAMWMMHSFGRNGSREGACSLHARIGLSDEQRSRLEPAVARFRESAAAVCAEARRHRAELFGLLAADTVDRSAVQAKQGEIAACQHTLQNLVVEHLLSQRELLSPEQRVELFRTLGGGGPCPGHGLTGSPPCANQPGE
jgi:uncharacterized membrane protein